MNPALSPVIIGVMAVTLAACQAERVEQPPQPTPVRVAAAETGADMLPISASAVVANKEEMRLSFKITGIVRRIGVEPGQTVKAGQRLAEIELAEIDSQVQQAQLAANKAQRDVERGEKLSEQRLISQQQLQDLRTQAQTAESMLQAAQFNRTHAVITAPGAGVVLRKLAEERELVAAGQPVLVIGALGPGYVVRAALADRHIVHVRLGDPAQVRLDAWPGQTFAAVVSEVAGAADERTGLFQVEARFTEPPPRLAGGLVARLEILPAAARTHTRTYIPIAAIIEGDGDRAAVFVVDGAHARRREVRVAFFAPQSVALAGGVEPGEQVVVEGARYLEDGEAIELLQ